ncbi:hypothetical protein [Paenibacillus sp. MMO-177]|uniref:hypothetical protein n=1 Tax=Paenibacillus sp. MMO-177 TaxID=3081289 RepID=UPI00301A9498
MTKYYDIELPWNTPLSVMDKHAEEIDELMKSAEGWKEIGIGLYVDESNLYLLDCNSHITSVYQRHDTSYQWYCGFDASDVASMRTVDGLKEFLKDFEAGEFAGMKDWEVVGYLTQMREDYTSYETNLRMSFDELREIRIRMMGELGWVFNEDKNRWFKKG